MCSYRIRIFKYHYSMFLKKFLVYIIFKYLKYFYKLNKIILTIDNMILFKIVIKKQKQNNIINNYLLLYIFCYEKKNSICILF